MQIAKGDAVALTRALVQFDSRNPGLVAGAPGEGALGQFLADVLRTWGFDAELMECVPGRPNVVARIGRARAGAKTLMFNGHVDVVGVEGMVHEPFAAAERNGRIYGRGACDMKGGVAAMCAAAAIAAERGIDGEIIVAAVVDEEFESIGTRTLLERGVRADAAVVTEPTRLAINPAHKGFTWTEILVHGRAAHGSRYDIGVDAIRHAAAVLVEFDRLEREVLTQRTHPLLGRASLHASTVIGGSGLSTYPEACTLTIERRTLPGETPDDAMAESHEAVQRAADTLRERGEHLSADVRHVFSQWPCDIPVSAPIVEALQRALAHEGEQVCIAGMTAWTDAALLAHAGIPAVLFGPGDIALAHSAEEWVEVDEVERATRVLVSLANAWCN